MSAGFPAFFIGTGRFFLSRGIVEITGRHPDLERDALLFRRAQEGDFPSNWEKYSLSSKVQDGKFLHKTRNFIAREKNRP